jgi:hypothetical protein
MQGSNLAYTIWFNRKNGIIGEKGFRKEIDRKMIEIKRPRRGRPRK